MPDLGAKGQEPYGGLCSRGSIEGRMIITVSQP